MTSLGMTFNRTYEEPILDLYFAEDKPAVLTALSTFLARDPAGIVASYVVGKENPFGAAEWKRYFGLEVVDAPKLPMGFYAWWFGPDPVETGKLCCQTHLLPVLRPAGMSHLKLGKLVKAPKEGNSSEYYLGQGATYEAGPACYLVLCKDIFLRNRSFDEQKRFLNNLNLKTGIGYEIEPSAVDLATVLFAHHVCSGKRHFGDHSGVEMRWTYSRAKKMGHFDAGMQLYVGGFGPDGLRVNYTNGDHEDYGIAGLRKF